MDTVHMYVSINGRGGEGRHYNVYPNFYEQRFIPRGYYHEMK